MLNKTIPVFYSIDDKYAPFLSVSLLSLSANSSPEYDYQVTILYQELNQTNQANLADLATDNVHIQFVAMDDLQNKMAGKQRKLRSDYFTWTIYFRLFIADLFPEYDRGIYFDADTIINTDLSELFNLDLQGNWVAAVPETFAASYPATADYVQEALHLPIEHYFNSGMMLLDLAALREHKFSDTFLSLFNAYHFDVMAPDQDYLNLMLCQHVMFLPRKWNSMHDENMTYDPQIIHYVLFKKPWHYADLPNEQYFWDYAKLSNYYPEIKQAAETFTDDDKTVDENNLEGIFSGARSIVSTGATSELVLKSRRDDNYDYWR